MLTLAEIGPGFYGAWRLALFDPSGMRYFDRSLRGFWRSFMVAILAAVPTALLIWLHLSGLRVDAGPPRILAAETIFYVIGWVAFPLVMFYVVPIIDRVDHYLGFIVAYNWASLIQLLVLLPAYGLAASQMLPPGASQALSFAAWGAILVYEWFVVRTALALPGLAAAGIVLLDVILSLIVDGLADAMVHVS
jgi:hypothetical protein